MENKYYKHIYPFIFYFFLFKIGEAQQPFRDFQIWQNFEIEYNINKRFLGHIQEQARFSENSTRFYYYYVDLGIIYKITKNIRINADYIFIQKRRLNDTYSSRHQYNFHLNFRKKWYRTTILNRFLTEGQYSDFLTSSQGKRLSDIYLRNKLSIRYKINSNLIPYISNEIYYKLDGGNFERGFNRNRISLGFLYKLENNWLFQTFYMFEHNFNIAKPIQNFALGFGISKSFFQ